MQALARDGRARAELRRPAETGERLLGRSLTNLRRPRVLLSGAHVKKKWIPAFAGMTNKVRYLVLPGSGGWPMRRQRYLPWPPLATILWSSITGTPREIERTGQPLRFQPSCRL